MNPEVERELQNRELIIKQLQEQVQAQQAQQSQLVGQHQEALTQLRDELGRAQGGQREERMVEGLNKLVGELVTTQLLQNVPSFGGEVKKYKEWIKSIERNASAVSETGISRNRLAAQSSKGVVGEFIHRFLRDHPNVDWDSLKEELAIRFGDIADEAHAKTLLRRVSQRENESATVYAERILELAEDAYPSTDLNSPVVAGQMIEIFIDGLRDQRSAQKVLRGVKNKHVKTLTDAVTIARDESEFQKSLQLRRKETPMEVDGIGSKESGPGRFNEGYETTLQCFNCNGAGHFARNCTQPKRCYVCNRPGHLARDCWFNPTRRQTAAQPATKQASSQPPAQFSRGAQAANYRPQGNQRGSTAYPPQ